MSARQVLLVRHGPGRARLPDYLRWALDDIAERRPEVWARIRFHHTGEPPPDLNGIATVVFWLADPLKELHPSCFEETSAIEERARAEGIARVNPPSVLSNSIKGVQARIWHSAGIPTPAHIRIGSFEELATIPERIDFPIIVRSDILHAQEGVKVCRDEQDLRRITRETLPLPASVTKLIDVPGSYSPHRGIWSRFSHKKRVFVFGDVVRNNHVYFSRDPIVGSGNTLFGHRELATGPWPDRLRFHVGSLIKKRSGRASKRDYRDSVQADLDFYDAAPEHPDIMLKAVQSLGFGFAALDYATLGDGSFLIWESNPYLFLYGPGDRQAQLSERNTLFRLLGHSWAMADFLERCADAPAG